MSHGNEIDPATELFLKQNITAALTDASSTNVKIDVLPAHDGEEIKKYIKEITDDEAVELLGGIEMSEDDRQLRLQVNSNAEKLEKHSLELNKVTVTMAGGNGVKGYVERTEDAIGELKTDIHDGFSMQHKEWSDFEKIFMDVIKGIKENTDTNTDAIQALDVRVKVLEEEKQMRVSNSLFIKRTIISSALGGAGITGIIIAFLKGVFK